MPGGGSAAAATSSCPAASIPPCTREPNSRSGTTTATRAIALLRVALSELAPHRFGATPHRLDRSSTRAHLEHTDLARDAQPVELLEVAPYRLGRRGVAKPMR